MSRLPAKDFAYRIGYHYLSMSEQGGREWLIACILLEQGCLLHFLYRVLAFASSV